MRTGQLELALATDAALERAEEWASRAWTWIDELPSEFRFTADDLRAGVGDPPGHGDAMGAAFRRARREGFIESVGVVTSQRPERHGSLVRVWRRV